MFLMFFLLAGLMVNFQNYEPGKNVKTYDITSIVPVAADHSPPIKNAPAESDMYPESWTHIYMN